MDDLARLLGERACERLLIEYCRLVDFGEAGRLADLFTEDGVWTADELVLDGRDAIRTHFLRRQGVTRRVSRHFLTNVAVDLRSADEADGLCYFANFRHDRREGDESLPAPAGLPKYTGEYHDRFVRTADGWRFAHHRVTTTFLRPPTPAPAPAA